MEKVKINKNTLRKYDDASRFYHIKAFYYDSYTKMNYEIKNFEKPITKIKLIPIMEKIAKEHKTRNIKWTGKIPDFLKKEQWTEYEVVVIGENGKIFLHNATFDNYSEAQNRIKRVREHSKYKKTDIYEVFIMRTKYTTDYKRIRGE